MVTVELGIPYMFTLMPYCADFCEVVRVEVVVLLLHDGLLSSKCVAESMVLAL